MGCLAVGAPVASIMGLDVHAIDFAARGVSGVSKPVSAAPAPSPWCCTASLPRRWSTRNICGSFLGPATLRALRRPQPWLRVGLRRELKAPLAPLFFQETSTSGAARIRNVGTRWTQQQQLREILHLPDRSWGVNHLMFRPGGWSTRGCLWGGMTMSISAEYRFGRESGK